MTWTDLQITDMLRRAKGAGLLSGDLDPSSQLGAAQDRDLDAGIDAVEPVDAPDVDAGPEV